MRSLKNIFLFFITMAMVLISDIYCSDRIKNTEFIEQCNTGHPYTYIEQVNTIVDQSTKQYCFEIIHDQHIDLKQYHLVVNINGAIVYSDYYKPKIVFPFVKTNNFNILVIILYDLKNKLVYSWQNKDVFDFEETGAKCYRIKLFSEKNKDHSNGIEMDVD